MGIALTWLGTNSFKVATPSGELLVDPFVCLDKAENRNSIEDFTGADAMLITHGHFDHLCSVPEILRLKPALVICTECAAATLRRDIASMTRDSALPDMSESEAQACYQCIVEVGPGSEFDLDDAHVRVFQGKHIDFDAELIAKTLLPSNLARAPRNLPLLLKGLACYPEAGQTIIYDIETAGLHIQFASLCPVDGITYPQNADVLVVPYQGRSDLLPYVRGVVGHLRPKRVVLSHFDDSFPPISQTVDTDSLQKMFAAELPHTELVIPQFKVPIEIS